MSLICLLAYPSSNATLSEFIILYKLTGQVILPIHPLFKSVLTLLVFSCSNQPVTLHTHSHSHTYTHLLTHTHMHTHGWIHTKACNLTHKHTIQTNNKERQKPTKTKQTIGILIANLLGFGDIATILALSVHEYGISHQLFHLIYSKIFLELSKFSL